MFGSGDDAIVFRVIALHPGDESGSHFGGQERVLAISLLATPPAGIPKNVNVRRPEVQPFHDVAVASTHRLVMLGACFSADHNRHVVNERGVESCRQTNRLGKHGSRTSSGYAMQGLTPPVIGRHLEAWNGASL